MHSSLRSRGRCQLAALFVLLTAACSPPTPPLVVSSQTQRIAWAALAELSPEGITVFDDFGASVAVSEHTVAVGAPGANDGQGAVYVYIGDGTTWEQQAVLTPSGDGTFGEAVALSGDTLLVGAPPTAYVFVRDGTSWGEQSELVSAGSASTFGTVVALDGDTAVVAEGTTSQGPAYVFVRDGSSWGEQAQLEPDDGWANDRFGSSVAVSGDTAVVGAIIGPQQIDGAAYVFVRDGESWSQQARLNGSQVSEGADYGHAVAVDGDLAAVGAPDDSSGSGKSGAVYVFRRQGQSWSQDAHLTASDAQAGDGFGRALAISGGLLLVGAPQRASNDGAVYAFQRAAGQWSETRAFAGDQNDRLGGAVALDGSLGVAGEAQGDAAQVLLSFEATSCAVGSECPTGHCVGGICCSTACEGQCESCSIEGKEGNCLPVTGEPPAGKPRCAGADDEECGGRCDGANGASCSYPAQGAPCGLRSCEGGIERSSACDGEGSCSEERTVDCAPYTCSLTDGICRESCSTDSHCSSGNVCRSGECRDEGCNCTAQGASHPLFWPLFGLLLLTLCWRARRGRGHGSDR